MCDAEKIEENFLQQMRFPLQLVLVIFLLPMSIIVILTISSNSTFFSIAPEKRVENLLLLFVQTANQSMWK